jgi:4-amino-4-deoxy-L-arabinose transferase-like glycosyltransferase
VQKIHRADLLVIAVLSLLWLIPLAFIGVAGEFPLNDDWAYARAAKRIIEIGQVERVGWTWIPAITHSWMGALFATLLPVPFFEALRWVGIVSGWLGIAGCYTLCRVVGGQPLTCGVAAAALAFNPLYLSLSFTYMTDVPFTALIAWSMVAYCIGARDRSAGWLALGTLLALMATLSRQTGVALPITMAIAIILAAPRELRSWAIAVTINAVVVGGYFIGLNVAFGPTTRARYSARNRCRSRLATPARPTTC